MPTSFDPPCVEISSVSNLKFEEFGRKVIIENPDKVEHLRVKIDGCVIKNGERADWLVSRPGFASVIIELKGRDVTHALEQVEATLAHCKAGGHFEGRVGALIMCKQVPRALTSAQRATDRFRKSYGSTLTISSSRYQFQIDDLVA